MIIAIDFDGVIHDHKNPVEGKRMGEPIKGAKKAIDALIRFNTLIVFSVWAGNNKLSRASKAIKDWLEFYEIPYNEITNIKPQADIYLDDKAIHFTTWQDFIDIIYLGKDRFMKEAYKQSHDIIKNHENS